MTFLVYFLGLLKSAIYGSTIYFTGSLTETVDVFDILALRYLMSSVVFWLLKATRIIKINVTIKDLFARTERWKQVKTLLLTGLCEPVLYMIFETYGIAGTSGITAAVILSLMPICSCLAEMLVLKERPTLMQVVFMIIGTIGVIYIAVKTDTSVGRDTVEGILFLFLTVAMGGLFMSFSRKASANFSSMEVTYVSSLMGCVAFNAINVVRHLYMGDIETYFAPYFNMENMIGFIVLAIVSTIIATVINNYVLGKIQVSTMSAFGGISTMITIVIDIIFNDARLYYFHIIGLVLIVTRMVGVCYIAAKKDKEKQLVKST